MTSKRMFAGADIVQHDTFENNLSILVEMIHTNPHMRSCMQDLQARCVKGKFNIWENEKRVTKDLIKKLNSAYDQFLREAIVMMTALGFIPFYLKKYENLGGISLPSCLPLGTFTWRTVSNSNSKINKSFNNTHCILQTEVMPRSGLIEAKNVYVFAAQNPVFSNSTVNVGPMQGLVEDYKRMRIALQKYNESNEWNSSKHVVITESVDLKDQTTSGLQLLDEQRRYHLTGFHNNLMHNNLLRLQGRDGYYMQSVRDGIFHHVRSEFNDDDPQAPASKRACCHIMPPNVQVTELNELNVPNPEEIEQRFVSNVYAFFNSKASTDLFSSSQASTAAAENVSRGELNMTQYVVRALERLIALVYAQSFDLHVEDIRVEISANSKLENASSDEIKAYADAEVLTGVDKLNVKKDLKKPL